MLQLENQHCAYWLVFCGVHLINKKAAGEGPELTTSCTFGFAPQH